MKKKLDTTSITNELQAASVFFRREPRARATPPLATIEEPAVAPLPKAPLSRTGQEENKPRTETVFVGKEEVDKVQEPHLLQPAKSSTDQQEEPQKTDGTVIPRHHDTVIPRYHSLTIPANKDVLEAIRAAVRQLGKEAATYRFTIEEKQALAEIVFDYKNRKMRTSENEISRIAINLLIIDYRTNGVASLLAKILDKLNG